MFLFGQMVAPSHAHAHAHVHQHDHAHHHEDEREAPANRCEACIVAVKDDADFEIDWSPELEPVNGEAVRPQLYPFDVAGFGFSTLDHGWAISTHPPPKPNVRPDTARAPPSIA